jgi:ABC-type proline/glycine betaine transport system substrate-binding protein
MSKSDIVNFSGTKVSGVFVVDKNKKYSLIKNNKFKATQFMKAILSSELNGKDYNSAVDKWLKNNQGVYGYKYKTENV